MRFLILCREPRLYSCRRLQEACGQRGIATDILDPNRMQLKLAVKEGKSEFSLYHQAGEIFDKKRPAPELLSEYDGVIPRFGTASTETGCTVLYHFEAKKVKVLNRAEAFRLARDKWRSLQALAMRNVPVPMSTLAGELVASAAGLAQHSSKVVIKTLAGSQGVGVMLSENGSAAQSIVETLKAAKRPVLLQEFVAESKGRDIRAFVIGKRVVAAVQRSGETGEFRANLHQGGRAEPIVLSKADQALAVRAAQVIGLNVAGVDLIRTESGLKVLEVNASPGLEGIEKASGADIAGQMLDYFLAEYFHRC